MVIFKNKKEKKTESDYEIIDKGINKILNECNKALKKNEDELMELRLKNLSLKDELECLKQERAFSDEFVDNVMDNVDIIMQYECVSKNLKYLKKSLKFYRAKYIKKSEFIDKYNECEHIFLSVCADMNAIKEEINKELR